MKLYHGGLSEVKTPRILMGEHIGDFGIGFYTTTSIKQARAFVSIKCKRTQKTQGVVSFYEVPDVFLKTPDFHVRVFNQANESWGRFVEANRRQPNFHHEYDIVFGPVANDQVYASFTLYENGFISFSELINRLKARKLTDQALFHTERSLTLLKHIGSETIQCSQK